MHLYAHSTVHTVHVYVHLFTLLPSNSLYPYHTRLKFQFSIRIYSKFSRTSKEIRHMHFHLML